MVKEILLKINTLSNQFVFFLKPNPADHWSIQVLKTIAKIPLVFLLLLLSPVLLVVFLIIFVIAL